MILTYSGRSRPSAIAISQFGNIRIHRDSHGDINWGRAQADTLLNSDISKATNKRVMRELFRDSDVPIPKLLTYHEAHNYALEGKKIVGRPDHHTKGRGFWLIDDNASFMKASAGTRKKKAATHFMEFIDAPHEYRVHIFNGKSIRISEKLHGSKGETSHGNYTTIKPTGRVFHVRKAAKKAVEAVGLDFGAVDVLATDEQCWVLEVNAAPGLGGTLPKLYAEAFESYMEDREW